MVHNVTRTGAMPTLWRANCRCSGRMLAPLMKYVMDWPIVILWVGCFLLALVHLPSTAHSYSGEVLIMNSATESIENGQLEVCGQTFKFGKLNRGKSTTIQYSVKSDSHFRIFVEFSSERRMSKELRYVTNGLDFIHVLTLTDNDASIELR